jgi:uncharacterized protein HemX
MGFLASLALGLGVPQRFAKAAGILGAVMLLIALLGLGKCAYDRSIIKAHTARQEASNARADRKADTRAAETRRSDDARLAQEQQQLERAQANAQNDTDRRLARHRCLRLQQAARAAGREPPACH